MCPGQYGAQRWEGLPGEIRAGLMVEGSVLSFKEGGRGKDIPDKGGHDQKHGSQTASLGSVTMGQCG